jgi:ATP-binding cassette subfamily F protein 3
MFLRPKMLVAYLPQHLLTTDGATVEEASKAFGEIFSMKAEIDEINEQLNIH